MCTTRWFVSVVSEREREEKEGIFCTVRRRVCLHITHTHIYGRVGSSSRRRSFYKTFSIPLYARAPFPLLTINNIRTVRPSSSARNARGRQRTLRDRGWNNLLASRPLKTPINTSLYHTYKRNKGRARVGRGEFRSGRTGKFMRVHKYSCAYSV